MKMNITLHSAHRTAVRGLTAVSFAFVLIKVYALAELLHSVPVAVVMNATLIGLNLLFLLCAWALVKQQSGAATFAALGSALTALIV